MTRPLSRNAEIVIGLQRERMERAEATVAALAQLLREAPILIVDRTAADLLGETAALEYADKVKAWVPRAKAALEMLDTEGNAP